MYLCTISSACDGADPGPICTHCTMALTPAGRGPQVMTVYLLFLSLSTIATAFRVYCRAVVIKLFGWDDWLAVLAWVCMASW